MSVIAVSGTALLGRNWSAGHDDQKGGCGLQRIRSRPGYWKHGEQGGSSVEDKDCSDFDTQTEAERLFENSSLGICIG
jgi:hypothetical protein